MSVSKPRASSLVFWILWVGSVRLMKDGPMGWVFPLAALVYRWREPLRRWMERWPVARVFWASGWLLGLLTEVFAILDNRRRPPAERALMHPSPVPDFVFGLFFYGLFMGAWTWLRRRNAYRKIDVFLISGLFGVATERGGAIARGIPAQPVIGTLLAFLVMCVYGIFPTLALLLTEHRWPARPGPRAGGYLRAGFALFLVWAFYGNLVHRGLLVLFPK